MNQVVPPSRSALHDIGFWWSKAIVIKPKSARHAWGGISFVMKIFVCQVIKTWLVGKLRKNREPLLDHHGRGSRHEGILVLLRPRVTVIEFQ